MATTTPITLQPESFLKAKKAALTIRAYNHKLRQQILKLIDSKENGEITVTEIYVKLRLEQSVASQHLAILRKASLVNTRRDGKFIYYTIAHEKIRTFLSGCEILNSL